MGERKIPMRMCIGCREMKPKRELIRVVKTPENKVVLDTTGKTNGRGAYLCKCADCLRKAEKNGALGRAFSMAVPSELLQTLGEELAKIDR